MPIFFKLILGHGVMVTQQFLELLFLVRIQVPQQELINGVIVQLARTPALQAGGPGFDPQWLHTFQSTKYENYAGIWKTNFLKYTNIPC